MPSGHSSCSYVLDLSNKEEVKIAANEIISKTSSIDILVNNAAIIHTALFQMTSEKKLKEYELTLDNSKKEVAKILLEAKNKLDKDIKNKKETMEKEIEIEIVKAQKDILDLKKTTHGFYKQLDRKH